MDSFRKACGALKDSTKVGLAKVNNSQFKELDIAIVKATNHVECPPKERHIRKIFAAISMCPRADLGYCIYALLKRLEKTRSWIVAIKTLIVIHRLLREDDPSFKEQLMRTSRRGNVFQISSFKDDSGPSAWDCPTWVRSYSLFLEERLECFRSLNYDIETEKAPKSAPEASNTQSETKLSNFQDMLEQLPSLQQLLYRLVCCQPEGAACSNFLIQYALALVVKESFKVYCAINDRIINLVDMFFEMPKHEAIKALDIYKKAGRQADQLANFYDFCKTLALAQTFRFPILKQPPPSFLETMEEYIREASQTGSVSCKRQECQDKKGPLKPEEPASEESEKQVKEVETRKEVNLLDQPESSAEKEPESKVKEVNPPPNSVEEPIDLLGLHEVNTDTTQLEESNALALAAVQPGSDPLPTGNESTRMAMDSWELALVTEPSSINKPQVAETKVGGVFESLLDSLYEDDASRRQLQMQNMGYNTVCGYETNPQNLYDQQDPFAMSNNMGSPTNVHMAMMSQQQQQMMIQQQQMMMLHQYQHQNQPNMMMMVPHNPYAAAQHSQQQTPQMWSTNPFGDPFTYPQSALPPNGNNTFHRS